MVGPPPGKSSLLASIEELPLAEQLSPKHLEHLAGVCVLVDFAEEAELFVPGDEADSIYLVISGRVSLVMEVPGREPTIVASFSRGDLFGWEALRADSVRSTIARASKATRCLRCPSDALRQLCELDHDFGYRVMSHAFDIVAAGLSDCRVRLLDIYGYGQA